MRRRKLIKLATVGLTSLTSGCSSLLGDGTKSIIVNNDTEGHNIGLEINFDGYSDSVSHNYNGGEQRTFADIPPNNDHQYSFDIKITVDDNTAYDGLHQYETDVTYEFTVESSNNVKADEM